MPTTTTTQKEMTAKEYLSRAFVLRKIIRAKEHMIHSLRDALTRAGMATGSGGVKSSRKKDLIGDLTPEIQDLITETQADYARLIVLKGEIAKVINAVERDVHRLILFERYVNLKPWEDIAADNGYSKRHVTRLHGHALATIKICP